MTNPKTYLKDDGRPDDRAWVYDAVFDYITSRTSWDRRAGKVSSKGDTDIYSQIAPTYGGERPSWKKKNRTVKREMISSALRRLVADGKIRVDESSVLDMKSMHGHVRRVLNHRAQVMGRECDGIRRTYVGTNVLQAIADALGEA
jgi:hypothetical protein